MILGVIILSSIALATESYIDKNDMKNKGIMSNIDLILNILFTIECVLKIIALGFVIESTTYLRDGWNRLDFVVVALSLFEIFIHSDH